MFHGITQLLVPVQIGNSKLKPKTFISNLLFVVTNGNASHELVKLTQTKGKSLRLTNNFLVSGLVAHNPFETNYLTMTPQFVYIFKALQRILHTVF